jgi:uncharacterized membrane-anchored protein
MANKEKTIPKIVSEIKETKVVEKTYTAPEPTKKEGKLKAKKPAKPANMNYKKMLLSGFSTGGSTLLISTTAFILGFFTLIVTLSVEAQTGFINVIIGFLVAYMIIVGLITLLLSGFTINVARKKLKKPKSLISFIISIISALLVLASIFIIYF